MEAESKRARSGFTCAVLYTPVVVQLYAEDDDSYMFAPQQRLQQYCRKNDMPFIDMLPYLKRFNEKKIYVDHCHYTPLGLGLIAQVQYDHVGN